MKTLEIAGLEKRISNAKDDLKNVEREVELKTKGLKATLEKVGDLLARRDPEATDWHHDFYEAIYHLNKKVKEFKESLAPYLNPDQEKIERYIVSVVEKKNHKLDPIYFSDTGSEEYNRIVCSAIVDLIQQGILNVDLHWNLCLGTQKLPEK